MNYQLINKLNTEVPQLNNKYYKLLYIYESKFGNTLERYSEENAIPYLNINLILSEKLQHVQASRRPYRAAEYLKELLLETEKDIICIDYYELLFEPSLNLNPFELFNSISRNKTLLITWRGDIKDGYFIHAVPGHPEYVKMPIKDAVLIH
ncbi:BREX-3 system P-loop-containing protein BrxF [Lysinibacillus telephonicus]|uniref:BREX-3 system P-loop-containing protein BrxF n=1 Tax=Lysinibacillus telephonicus TaxID=1714840 RepID=A0A3S0JQZ6_9BACI|nr:BREX-3 system P-loop-containing protein BrxF [Lysinibacillus telephonicus]RTQ92253.1 BREX-3 system P-loop-containing protein BrxF [Lysinibacillus telephonicus]